MTLGEFRQITKDMPDSAKLEPFVPFVIKTNESPDISDYTNLRVKHIVTFPGNNAVNIQLVISN